MNQQIRLSPKVMRWLNRAKNIQFSQIPARHRQIVRMLVIHGLNNVKIANNLRVSVSDVEKALTETAKIIGVEYSPVKNRRIAIVLWGWTQPEITGNDENRFLEGDDENVGLLKAVRPDSSRIRKVS